MGDWEGKQTFVGEGSQSVLDLVIEMESEIGSIIEKIEVLTRIESDHLPVRIEIGKMTEKGMVRERGGGEEPREEDKLKWDEEKSLQYAQKMGEKLQDLGSQEKGAQERWGNLIKTVYEVGRELNMIWKR